MNSVKIYLFVTIISIAIISLVSAFTLNKNQVSSVNPTPSSETLPSPTATPAPDQKQTKSEANVTIEVKPLVLEREKLAKFEITFNTHSVELDFDVTKVASLTDEDGNSLGNSIWEGTEPGGHHRSGTLTFQNPLTETAGKIYLNFYDIAGIPVRTFEENIQ